MTNEVYQYGSWVIAIVNIALFLCFILVFLPNKKKRDWRSAGIYSAFIVALFTEMYGIPLTIYVLSSVFGVPIGYSNAEGHLLANLLARLGVWNLNVGVVVVMGVSTIMILAGLWLVIGGWRKVYKSKGLVTDGIYAHVRHPQYFGIFLITLALLVQWPTLLTLAMWPILLVMYRRLARREERELETKFGEKYLRYKRRVPMFLPSLRTRNIDR